MKFELVLFSLDGESSEFAKRETQIGLAHIDKIRKKHGPVPIEKIKGTMTHIDRTPRFELSEDLARECVNRFMHTNQVAVWCRQSTCDVFTTESIEYDEEEDTYSIRRTISQSIVLEWIKQGCPLTMDTPV